MQVVYILDIKDIEKNYERILNVLPLSAVQKAEEFNEKDDKLRSVGGSLLIEAFTAKEPYFFGANGKPYKKEPPFFNISHSGDKVGIFLSSDGEVGFDIQLIKPQSEQLKNYIFSAEERQFINTDADFAKFWTMKEAAAKCAGTGIIALKKNPVIEITDNSFVFKTEKFYYKTFILGGYAVCACSAEQVRAEILPISVEFVFKTLAKRV